MLLVKTSELVPLNDALRGAHESLAQQQREEIAKRREKGIPLDDETDFGDMHRRVGIMDRACSEMDGASLREQAIAVMAGCSGGIQELDPFEPNPEYDGIRIRVRNVSEGKRIEVHEAVQQAGSAAARHSVFRDFVGFAIAEVHGLEDESGPVEIKGNPLPPDALDVLDGAGLITELWSAARHFSTLPASKKKHFGSRPQSGSPTSTAPSAASGNAPGLDVTAAPARPIDSQSATPTPAPAGT